MNKHAKVSLLVVGTHPVCKDIAEYVRGQAMLSDFPSNFSVDVCESVEDLPEIKRVMAYDYVVLTVDPKKPRCLEELRNEAGWLKKHLLMGCVCIVNIFCKIRTTIDIEDLLRIRTELDVILINADCSTKDGVVYLGKRIVCGASAALGVKSGIPISL